MTNDPIILSPNFEVSSEYYCPIPCTGQLCRSCRFDRCLLGGMCIRAIKSYDQREDLQLLALELERRKQHLLDKRQEEDGDQAANRMLCIALKNSLTQQQKYCD